MCPSSLRPCSMPPPSKFRFLGQATWTAETSTSTREPPPTAQNAAIFFISASQLRLIWTAVARNGNRFAEYGGGGPGERDDLDCVRFCTRSLHTRIVLD